MRFTTTVQLHGKSATGIEVPPEVVDALGSGKKPKVVVTIGGYSYRTTVGVMGGKSLLPLSAEHRKGAGVEAGQEVDVDVELDTAPREVEVPDALAEALAAAGKREAFDALNFSTRKEHARSVTEAKAEATRDRRIAKVLDSLG
jgi:hypothetical protein